MTHLDVKSRLIIYCESQFLRYLPDVISPIFVRSIYLGVISLLLLGEILLPSRILSFALMNSSKAANL